MFLIHGDADEIVPVGALSAAVAGLQAADIPVRFEIRPGLPHAIDPEGIAHGGAFLAAAFGERLGVRFSIARSGSGSAGAKPKIRP